MSAAGLFEDLMNLPVESNEFDQIEAIKLEDLEDDTYEADSFGSCCSSPTQSSSDCASPQHSSEASSSPTNDYSAGQFFTFTVSDKLNVKKKQSKLENKVKRNERERRRVRRLAEGFRKLRNVVPGEKKKMSKLQTLQLALQYMADLTDTITMNNERVVYPVMETPIMTQPDFSTYQPLQIPTKLLSHPPVNWPFSAMPNQIQQQHPGYPVMDQCNLIPAMQQVPGSGWFY